MKHCRDVLFQKETALEMLEVDLMTAGNVYIAGSDRETLMALFLLVAGYVAEYAAAL